MDDTTTPFHDIDNVNPIRTQSADNNNNNNKDDDSLDIQTLTDTWRTLPALNPTIEFKSWIIPKGQLLQQVVQHEAIQPYLASRHELLQEMHGRVKVIRDYDDDNDDDDECKLVLLHPDTPSFDHLDDEIRNILQDCRGDGPVVPQHFSYRNFTAAFILHTVLPVAVHPPPTAFETIGHVAHLNLRTQHLPYRHVIGQILVETLPNIETVIHKVGQVQGPYRTYDLQVLAGRPDTAVHLQECGVVLQFDVAAVYWCSRLSQERQRLLEQEIQDGQFVADAFCGVGALCLQAAVHKHCRIAANDWNPAAVQALEQNVQLNGVAGQFITTRCGDAYEFLMDLGTVAAANNDDDDDDDDAQGGLPDHIHMNYPLEAPTFLGALRWWPVAPRKARKLKTDQAKSADKERSAPRVHVYTFARADADTNRTAEQVAVDIIAQELLPAIAATHRWQELNDEYNCALNVHAVRDVAPGKLVVCVSFSATDKLLRYMQGDFS